MRNPFFTEKVKHIEVKNKTISDLLREMEDTGFQGRKLGEVTSIWEEMIEEENLTIIMGLAGSLSTSGMYKIINWLIENRFIDVLVSTGANISEDILAITGSYWKGSHLIDDRDLLKYRVDRFYDVYADENEYREMEKLIYEFIKKLEPNHEYSSREFLYLFGKWLHERGVDSIAAVAYEHKVPVFCPAIVDSGYGVAALMARWEGYCLEIDQFKDFEELVEICDRSEKTGVIYIGGGVPKDFIQLAAVAKCLKRGGEKTYPHEYAIQITTDSPQWGGLSGCTLEEAVSWGKISEKARKATCYCDATIALPIIAHALMDRCKGGRLHAPDLSWLFNNT